MDIIFDFLKRDYFLLLISILFLVLLIAYIVTIVKYSKLNKRYIEFMRKLGNGNNVEDILKSYIQKVESIEKTNQEVISYCERLDNNMAQCTQKIGIVRYNAFKDTGSDLSFALALLDGNNDGVVLNGIYSREMSNIYAKPIVNGKSTYTITEEEQQAINKAMQVK